ncbi:rhythmically expressed gene 2 protein-like [Panonychus citri]|uniref:rhythmically expressed gene 2 protein-like n=1 Tax=Panonychus citri TaxID=50023 RepID=UPI002307A03F|nr:rhythmically expressed gene 2 protein-like [Panonychus citri]
MQSLRLITFDVTNTLVKVKCSIGYEYCKIAELYGIKCSSDDMINRMNANFKLSLKKIKKESPAYGAVEGITCYQWWYRVMYQTFISSGVDISSSETENKFKQTTAHLYKYFSTSEPYQLVDGAEQTLRTIKGLRKSDDCPIGVLSNSDERLPLILGELGVAHFFDFILLPQITKIEKPDAKAFQAAQEKGDKVDPSQALHIGDDLMKDYHGAKNCGWNAIFVDLNNTRDASVDPDDRIPTIKELINHKIVNRIN